MGRRESRRGGEEEMERQRRLRERERQTNRQTQKQTDKKGPIEYYNAVIFVSVLSTPRAMRSEAGIIRE